MISEDSTELAERIYISQARAILFIHSKEKPRNRRIPAQIKLEMRNIAGSKCRLCPNILTYSPQKKKIKIQEATEVSPDHIHDLVLGGQNEYHNFMLICNQCNWSKNYALQKHLTLSGENGSPSADLEWRGRLIRDPQNISKLMEYIEWSHRISENYTGSLFPDLYRYFNEKRFGMTEKSNRIHAPNPKISIWKRIFTLITGVFKKNTMRKIGTGNKNSENISTGRNILPIPASKLIDIRFTPEEFSKGLLRQKKRNRPVTFTTLYSRLIKEDSRFNLKNIGIKPADYLVGKCSELIKIIEKPDTDNPSTIHYWITEHKG